MICTLPVIAPHTHEDGDCVYISMSDEMPDVETDDEEIAVDDLIPDPVPSEDDPALETSGETEEPIQELETIPEIMDMADIPVEAEDVCILPEVEYHLHTAECFSEDSEEGTCICGKIQVMYPAYTSTDGDIMVRVCGTEEHEHIDSCYPEDHEPSYIFGKEYYCGYSAHIHTETCYDTDGYLVCTLPEHIHTDLCLNPQQEEDEDGEYVCGMAAHMHTVECFDENGDLICDLPLHIHTEECLPPAYYCEKAEHTHHPDVCYDENGQLICGVEEHIHGADCLSNPIADLESPDIWEESLPAFSGYIREDLVAVADSQIGYEESKENYIIIDPDTLYGMTRYGQFCGDPYAEAFRNWSTYFADFCLYYAGADAADTQFELDASLWLQTLLDAGKFVDRETALAANSYAEEDIVVPTPGDIAFLDTDDDGEADRVGVISSLDAKNHTITSIEGDVDGMVAEVCYSMEDANLLGYGVLFTEDGAEEEENASPAEPAEPAEVELQDEIEAVIQWIEAIPSIEEIETEYAALEEAGDEDALADFLEKLTAYVSFVYTYYEKNLTPEEQAQIVNADKLEDYTWLYTELLAITKDEPCSIFGVNSTNWDAPYQSVIYTSIPSDLTLKMWVAYEIAPVKGGYYQVKRIVPVGTLKSTCTVPAGGFVHMFHKDTSGIVPALGTYVSVSGDFWKTSHGATKYSLGTITYLKEEPVIPDTPVTDELKEEKDNWAEKKLSIKDTVSTKDFIELNLYDYGENINDLFDSTRNDGTGGYPGFQYNIGGQGSVNNPGFGENIKTEFSGGGISFVADEKLTHTINAVYEKQHLLSTPSGSKYSDARSNYSISMDPDVYRTGGASIMKPKLVDGYPMLASGKSLKYLFSETSELSEQYATKMNKYTTLDNLFSYSESSGVYTYDSRKNHAQFVAGTEENPEDTFVVYNQLITPNYIMYAFGNFLPFNDIIHDAKRVTEADRNYLKRVANTAGDIAANPSKYPNAVQGISTVYTNLQNGLDKYITAMDSQLSGQNWTMVDAANYYYTHNSNIPQPPVRASVEDTYCIDYDVAKNFFFGMEMKMNFMQSKNGKTSKGLPMVLSFTGDDDVWFYIDDYLFLDLSGIHRHVGGQIDFEKGEVRYYSMDYNTGAVIMVDQTIDGEFYKAQEPVRVVKFADILGSDAKRLLNSKGTFKNYSFHSLNFYYMERGSGSSVCRLEFNMEQTVPTSIYKVDQYGDPIPGAKFAVYPADEDYNYLASAYDYDPENAIPMEMPDIVIPAGTKLIPNEKDGSLTYNGQTVKPVYYGVTDKEGAFTFVKEDNTYYSIGELQRKFGKYFILREYYVPDGYRTVSDEVRLFIENDTIECNNTYQSGAWASPNALVTGTPELTVANDGGIYENADITLNANGKIDFIDAETRRQTGTLFAVILKRRDNPLPEGEMKTWSEMDFSSWYPVYGSEAKGYTVLDDFKGSNLATVIEAAKKSEEYGSICFGIGINQRPQLVVENAPGKPQQYLTYILNNLQSVSDEEGRKNLQFTAAYYYTSASNVSGATVNNTVRIKTHFETSQDEPFSVMWGSTIAIPNIENRFAIQKTAPKEDPRDPDVFLTNAVFAMYPAEEDKDGHIYYIAADGTHIYLNYDDDGDNLGVAGTVYGEYTGTYKLHTEGINLPSNETSLKFIKDTEVSGITGGDIEVTIGKQTYIIRPAVNAKHERLVNNTHDVCTLVNERGTAHYSALLEGRYILREIISPRGYALNTTETKVAITGTGIYIHAGTENDGVIVGNGAGYVVASLENVASEGLIDETLTWIYTALKVNKSSGYDVFDNDGRLLTEGYAAKDENSVVPGHGNAIVNTPNEAMVSYLMFDSQKGEAENERGTLFNYFPNLNQDPREDASAPDLSTKAGEGTQLLFTDAGWSELAVFQDYLFGKTQSTVGVRTNYENRSGENLMSLFSKSRFVRYTDQLVRNLKVIKVDSMTTETTLTNASFVLYREIDGVKRYYNKLSDGTISYTALQKDETEMKFAITCNDVGEILYENLTSAEYYLKELKAPDGYKVLRDPMKLTVKNGVITSVDSGGKDVFLLVPGTDDNTMIIYVKNRANYTLPNTGFFGGTTLCTYGGMLCIALPFVYIIQRRKRGRGSNFL